MFDYDDYEACEHYYYESDYEYFHYPVMTRRELIINWLRQRPWRLRRLYWRIKWHNRCSECGIDTNNGFILCDKHEIPF